jgi:hypothetical protein
MVGVDIVESPLVTRPTSCLRSGTCDATLFSRGLCYIPVFYAYSVKVLPYTSYARSFRCLRTCPIYTVTLSRALLRNTHDFHIQTARTPVRVGILFATRRIELDEHRSEQYANAIESGTSRKRPIEPAPNRGAHSQSGLSPISAARLY